MNLHSFFAINFAPAVGIAFLLVFLGFNARLDERVKRLFFLLLALEAAELITYNVELVFAARSVFSPWRVLLSAIGYTLRPILGFLVLQLTLHRRLSQTERALMLLPSALNLVISFSAFWTDIAYSYTPSNEFVRGPLGYSSHICVFLYLAILVGVTFSLKIPLKAKSCISPFFILPIIWMCSPPYAIIQIPSSRKLPIMLIKNVINHF